MKHWEKSIILKIYVHLLDVGIIIIMQLLKLLVFDLTFVLTFFKGNYFSQYTARRITWLFALDL